MIIYTDGNPRHAAYVRDPGGSGHTELPAGISSMEAEYLAIIFALNEYFLAHTRDLDERQDDLDTERLRVTGEEEFYSVATPAGKTPRPLPGPIEIRCDNEVVVKQLSRQYHIGSESLRKLAQQIWKMTEKLEVKYSWVSRKENLAGMMLK